MPTLGLSTEQLEEAVVDELEVAVDHGLGVAAGSAPLAEVPRGPQSSPQRRRLPLPDLDKALDSLVDTAS